MKNSQRQKAIVLLLVILIFFIAVLLISKNSFLGLVTHNFNKSYLININYPVNKVYTNSTTLDLSKIDTLMYSFQMSGYYAGDGNLDIYLKSTNGQKVLVYSNKKNPNKISGLVVGLGNNSVVEKYLKVEKVEKPQEPIGWTEVTLENGTVIKDPIYPLNKNEFESSKEENLIDFVNLSNKSVKESNNNTNISPKTNKSLLNSKYNASQINFSNSNDNLSFENVTVNITNETHLGFNQTNQSNLLMNLTDNETTPTDSNISVNSSNLEEAVDLQNVGDSISSTNTSIIEMGFNKTTNETNINSSIEVVIISNVNLSEINASFKNNEPENKLNRSLDENVSHRDFVNNISIEKNKTENLTTNEITDMQKVFAIKNVCYKTCSLLNFNASQLEIKIEGNITLKINALNYSAFPFVYQKKNFPSIKLEIGKARTINLSNYFVANGNVIYDVSSVPGFVFNFKDDVVEITATSNVSQSVFFYATNGDKLLRSNKFVLSAVKPEPLPDSIKQVLVDLNISKDIKSEGISSLGKFERNVLSLPKSDLISLGEGQKTRLMLEINSDLPVYHVGNINAKTINKESKEKNNDKYSLDYKINKNKKLHLVENQLSENEFASKAKIKNKNFSIDSKYYVKLDGNYYPVKELTDKYVVLEIDLAGLKTLSNKKSLNSFIEDSSFSSFTSESLNITGFDKVNKNYSGLNGLGVSVCVIDSGFNPTSVNFPINQVKGYNFIDSNNNYSDDYGHGTAVTYPLTRAAPRINLLIAKVINGSGIGYSSDILDALDWCSEQGANIVSFSIGEGLYAGACDDHPVAEKVNNLSNSGILVVASSGNKGNSASLVNPACATSSLAVGASTKSGGLWNKTNYDPMLRMLAPGENIQTYFSDGSSTVLSGTSLSSPFVAGAAALIFEDNNFLSVDDMKNLLINTGDVFLINDFNFTRLNVYNAINHIYTNNFTVINLPQVNSTDGVFKTQLGCSDCGDCGGANGGGYCNSGTCDILPTCALCVLDGYGYTVEVDGQDVHNECSPNFNSCYSSCEMQGGDGFCAGGGVTACDSNDRMVPTSQGTYCTGSGSQTAGACSLTDLCYNHGYYSARTCDGSGNCNYPYETGINPESSSEACTCDASSNVWISGGDESNSKCCGNSGSSDDWDSNTNGVGCCCDGSQIGENAPCPGNGNKWCVDGSYCTNTNTRDDALSAEGTTYTMGSDSTACGFDNSGAKCNSDGTTIAKGICANSTCATGTVCSTGVAYYTSMSSCSDNDPCDTDVTPTSTTPRFVRNGYVCGAGADSEGYFPTCVVDGSLANGIPCCINSNCASGTCATDNSGNKMCRPSTCNEGRFSPSTFNGNRIWSSNINYAKGYCAAASGCNALKATTAGIAGTYTACRCDGYWDCGTSCTSTSDYYDSISCCSDSTDCILYSGSSCVATTQTGEGGVGDGTSDIDYCNSGTWIGADASSTACTAVVGSGNWAIGGEVDSTTCCGDDSGEYANHRWDYFSSHNGFFDTNIGDKACCDADTDCVYNGVCYTGDDVWYDIDGNGMRDGLCHTSGEWLDADRYISFCTGGGGHWNVGSGDANVESNYYTILSSGTDYCNASGAGQIVPSTRCCCGDDSGENYEHLDCDGASVAGCVDDSGDAACCNSATDCVVRGMCYTHYSDSSDPTTTSYDFGSEKAVCVLGSWVDPDGHVDRCTEINSRSGWSATWSVAGEVFGEYSNTVTQQCCGDDSGENYISSSYHASIDLPSSPTSVCCSSSNDCVDSGLCTSNNGIKDVGGNGPSDYCFAGTWYDCNSNTNCDTSNGFHCDGTPGNCTKICTQNSVCPNGFYCDGPGGVDAGICTPQKTTGGTCDWSVTNTDNPGESSAVCDVECRDDYDNVGNGNGICESGEDCWCTDFSTDCATDGNSINTGSYASNDCWSLGSGITPGGRALCTNGVWGPSSCSFQPYDYCVNNCTKSRPVNYCQDANNACYVSTTNQSTFVIAGMACVSGSEVASVCATPGICANQYQYYGGLYCNGMGSCTQNGNLTNVTSGEVCDGGFAINPNNESDCGFEDAQNCYCDETFDCVDNACFADRYLRGFNGIGDCVEIGKVSNGTFLSGTSTISETNYKINISCTLNSDNCNETDHCLTNTYYTANTCAAGSCNVDVGVLDPDSGSEACTCDSAANGWNIGGEVAAENCCGDDSGENKNNRVADTSMDNSYATNATDNACCNSATDCVDTSTCYAAGYDQTSDVDGDGDADYCKAGTWYDCSSVDDCLAGEYCTIGNECIAAYPQGRQFKVDNNSGSSTLIVDESGDLFISGDTYESQGILNPPDNSFIIKNSTGTVVSYVDSLGNLYMLGNYYVGSAMTPSGSNLIIKNTTNTIVYFDNQGNLRINGILVKGYTE